MVKTFKLNMSSSVKKNLMEWWAIGAIYFFIGFGSFAAQTDAIDLIFFLGIAIGIVKTYMMPRFTDEDYYSFKKKEKSSVFRLTKNIVLAVVLTTGVIYTYELINLLLVKGFNLPAGRIVVYPEPVLFGIFYVVYEKIVKRVLNKISRR